MKLPSIRRILREDLARGGADLPHWLDALLSPLNSFIDQVVLSLRNNLTFKDNFACTITTQSLTYGAELVINPLSAVRVSGMLLIDSSGYQIKQWAWSRKDSGAIGVRAKWVDSTDTAPTSTDSFYVLPITFVILLG